MEDGNIASNWQIQRIKLLEFATLLPESPGVYLMRDQDDAKRIGECRVLPTGCATIARQGNQIAPIAEMTQAGAIAFTDDGDVIEDEAMMVAVLCAAQSVDRCLMQHCQAPELTIGGVMHAGAVQEELGYGAWPREAEESIIERDLKLNAEIGCAWHAQHLSSGGSVAIIANAQKAGQRATGEASPHHLLLTDAACKDLGTVAKMNPPPCEHKLTSTN